MMISPEGYISRLEDADYNTLIEERSQLITYIVEYEKKEKAGDRTGEEWLRSPRADVRYQVYLTYLSKLCSLMRERYNEDYVWGDKTLSETGEIKYGTLSSGGRQ